MGTGISMAHRGSGEVVSGGGRVGAGLWAVRGKGLGCGRCPGVKLPHGGSAAKASLALVFLILQGQNSV